MLRSKRRRQKGNQESQDKHWDVLHRAGSTLAELAAINETPPQIACTSNDAADIFLFITHFLFILPDPPYEIVADLEAIRDRASHIRNAGLLSQGHASLPTNLPC
jgi:hypothetical protein